MSYVISKVKSTLRNYSLSHSTLTRNLLKQVVVCLFFTPCLLLRCKLADACYIKLNLVFRRRVSFDELERTRCCVKELNAFNIEHIFFRMKCLLSANISLYYRLPACLLPIVIILSLYRLAILKRWLMPTSS